MPYDFKNAKLITSTAEVGEPAYTFIRRFDLRKLPVKATLEISALGVYDVYLGGKRIGDFVLAPGWTSYDSRIQVQSYDVTSLIGYHNELTATVANGWFHSRLAWSGGRRGNYLPNENALIAVLTLTYADGHEDRIVTDEKWTVKESRLRLCEIYDGEIYDAAMDEPAEGAVKALEDFDYGRFIPQEGEKITEEVVISPKEYLVTPNGERVIDFGQELTGYIRFKVKANKGDRVKLKFFEILDRDGNVYTANYRSAKAELTYICADGEQEYKTTHTFYGFRRIRIDEFPGEINLSDFEAIAVHSNIKRTGRIECSSPMLNRLFSNIFWGQRGNFLDIPTDCPQRDERLGWTGDTEVFCRAASYNFDCEKFYDKWLGDLIADQTEDGGIPHVVPNVLGHQASSCAWGDVAVILPWQVYLTYGNREILKKQYESMKLWAKYIEANTHDEYLWTGCWHYGDWCALDLGRETTDSASNKDFLASVYYANTLDILIRAGKVIGRDTTEYSERYPKAVAAIREHFPELKTQTEYALLIYFHIAEDPIAAGNALAKLVADNGYRLNTGFVGTPYLLHALSMTGHSDIAYSLLMQDKFPSWLFSVSKGATTIWEHWDGIKEDGSVWSADMNSYNHYAYGAVADWVYGVAAGIGTVEDAPGFERVTIAPVTDDRLDFLSASIETRHGLVYSKWEKFEGGHRYEIETPVDCDFTIDGVTRHLTAGNYLFFGK